jgi:flagellar protein FlaG
MKITDVTSALSAAQVTVARLTPPAPAEQMGPAQPEGPDLAAPGPAQVSEAQLRQQVDAVNKALKESSEEHLQFSIHQGTNHLVIKLVNDQTHEVLKEFPSEKFLDVVADLMKVAGLQVDETR